MAKNSSIEMLSPRENPHLFGHEAVEQRFLHEFSNNLTHHAYLITGSKGIGKATLAYRMARFALGQGASAPAEAPSLSLFGDAPEAPTASSLYLNPDDNLFRRIASGSHSDLRVLEPEEDSKKQIISVDAARKIPEFLSLTPAEGNYRVVVIDAAEQLNPNAANALLKTIEEPPARAMLFLISHAPGKLLPTIRSRCRHYALQAPDEAAFAQVLQHVAPYIADADYAALYALSAGSPGFAISLNAANGVEWYRKWLKAMQPSASLAERQQFADSASAQKSPEAWEAILHGWHTAMHRLTLHPHACTPIDAEEKLLLSALASATPPQLRSQWMEQGAKLLHETETFNLDKRLTLRLLTNPSQLDRLVA